MPTFPIVNLNGESVDNLYKQNQAVIVNIDVVIYAMRQATPHGRDFQTHQDPEAWKKAKAEHLARLASITALRMDYDEICNDLLRQKEARERQRKA